MEQELILMHGDREVATVGTDAEGRLSSIIEVDDPEHMPPGTFRKGADDIEDLRYWWSKRCIPTKRRGIGDALGKLGMPSPEALMISSMGLNLTDSYWILNPYSELRWSHVNLFENPFSEDLGDVICGADAPEWLDHCSPDASTDGVMVKRWGSDRVLCKTGGDGSMQEPFNEAIASEVCRRLGIPCVEYDVTMDAGVPYSRCPTMSSPGTEFVPLWQVLLEGRRDGSTLNEFSRRTLVEHGMEPDRFFDHHIVLDYLMLNEDRHFGNLGVLRDPGSLRFKGFAPVFDTGSSLSFGCETSCMTDDRSCKLFKRRQEDQIRLLSDTSWIDLGNLDGMEDSVAEIFSCYSSPVPAERVSAVSALLRRRIDSLASVLEAGIVPRDDIADDRELPRGLELRIEHCNMITFYN